ncbi:MAG: ABC transporter substrate-binding protein [Candidatus Hydrogenedentes bacterium]|nr:ABC transporter substrate-binding protein [Candidatus Hydrogenedentota bacterium]
MLAQVLVFVAQSLAQPTASGDNLDDVTLQLKWKHQFQFAGFYAAIEKGFYREAGLNVTLREAESSEGSVKNVLSGEAQFGVASSELVVMRAEGKPVVALAPIFQHSPLILLVLRDSGIENLHELSGKRIMLEPQEAELYAYFESEGISLSKLIVVPNTFDAADLIAGKVDAMSAYSTDEPFRLREAGKEYLVFNPRAGGIDFYGDTLFTSEDQIQRDPDRVRRFLDASLKGWDYALHHSDEIIELILAKYSTRHSREHLQFEAEAARRLIEPDLVEIGYVNPGRWRSIAETYARHGMMPANASLQGFLYERSPSIIPKWMTTALIASIIATVVVLIIAIYLFNLYRIIRKQKELLQAAVDDIKILRGIIPVCSYCKKIRDDKGAWQGMEEYITEHSHVLFSHGICSDCMTKEFGVSHRPDIRPKQG